MPKLDGSHIVSPCPTVSLQAAGRRRWRRHSGNPASSPDSLAYSALPPVFRILFKLRKRSARREWQVHLVVTNMTF